MESVAWVENLGPRGHVLNRQPVFKWPVRISRSYDGDVVVDERSFTDLKVDLTSREGEQPLLALRINEQRAANASVQLSINGKAPSFDEAGCVLIGGDDVLQCGATRLRIRLRGHAVSYDHANEKVAWHKTWGAAITVACGWFVLYCYFSFANSVEEDIAVYFEGPLTGLLGILLWWGVWSSISNIVSGMSFAREHLLMAGMLFAALNSFEYLGSLAAFATGMGSLANFGKLLQLVAIGWAIHGHLLLVKPARPLLSVFRAALVPAFAWLFLAGGVAVIYPPEQQPMAYDTSIWPASFLISQGESEEQFLKKLDEAKEKVDDAAKLIGWGH